MYAYIFSINIIYIYTPIQCLYTFQVHLSCVSPFLAPFHCRPSWSHAHSAPRWGNLWRTTRCRCRPWRTTPNQRLWKGWKITWKGLSRYPHNGNLHSSCVSICNLKTVIQELKKKHDVPVFLGKFDGKTKTVSYVRMVNICKKNISFTFIYHCVPCCTIFTSNSNIVKLFCHVLHHGTNVLGRWNPAQHPQPGTRWLFSCSDLEGLWPS